MKTLRTLIVLFASCLLPLSAQAAGKAATSWATVDFGKDEALIPVVDGVEPKASSETIDNGIYYATFFRKGEDLSNWTTMMVVAVYAGTPKDTPAPPARMVLDFQLKESRDNCPPENFLASVDPEDHGRYGQLTACKFIQPGKTNLVYEYTVTQLATEQVFSVTRLARIIGTNSTVEPPPAVIAAWKEDMKRMVICSRVGGAKCQVPAGGK